MHVTREVVNGEHTGGGARYADRPRQAVNHQPPQFLAPSVLDMLVIDLRQQLLRERAGRKDAGEGHGSYVRKRRSHIPICHNERDGVLPCTLSWVQIFSDMSLMDDFFMTLKSQELRTFMAKIL